MSMRPKNIGIYQSVTCLANGTQPHSVLLPCPAPPPPILPQGDTAGDAFSGFVIATATKKSITYDYYRLAHESQGLVGADVLTMGYTKAFTTVSTNWKKPVAADPSCSC